MAEKKIYNLAENAEKLGVSPEVLKKLVIKAIDGYLVEVSLLKKAEAENNFHQLKTLAHKLKGSFGNYLLLYAYSNAAVINDNSEEKKSFDYKKSIDEIESYLAEVKRELEQEHAHE